MNGSRRNIRRLARLMRRNGYLLQYLRELCFGITVLAGDGASHLDASAAR